MSSFANSKNVNHLKTNQPLTVPSIMVTNSEGFIAREMAILQSKLKELFALDMADFHATEQSNISVAHSIVNHPKKNGPNVTSPPTPIYPSSMVKSERFIAGEVDELKKLLNQLPVRMNQISHRYFFQTCTTPIVHCVRILEELKHKYQEILARQKENASAKTEKFKERDHQVKVLSADNI